MHKLISMLEASGRRPYFCLLLPRLAVHRSIMIISATRDPPACLPACTCHDITRSDIMSWAWAGVLAPRLAAPEAALLQETRTSSEDAKPGLLGAPSSDVDRLLSKSTQPSSSSSSPSSALIEGTASHASTPASPAQTKFYAAHSGSSSTTSSSSETRTQLML